jgi:hypothetical protein
MKHFYTLGALLFFIAALTFTRPAFTFRSGPPAGLNGSPINPTSTCTNCHSGAALNAGPEVLAISFSGAANQYVPGTTYTVTVAFTSTTRTRHGFQLSALSGTTQAGTITSTTANTSTQTSQGITYINHNLAGSNLSSWSFNWTAPSVSVGTITFYASGNATNANGSTSGDNIYTTTLSISPASTSGLPVASTPKLQLLVYPNPASEYLDVVAPQLEGETAYYQLTDRQGRVVQSQHMDAADWQDKTYRIVLPTSLPAGFYIASVRAGRISGSTTVFVEP